MKYRNKDTGVIVEAMQITAKVNTTMDIMKFGSGLIHSVETRGFNLNESYLFVIEAERENIYCLEGDYLVKGYRCVYKVPRKEFDKYFELIEEENDTMKNKIKYYVNKANGNVVSALKNIDVSTYEDLRDSDDALKLGEGLIRNISILHTVTEIALKGSDENDVKIPVHPNDYIIREKNDIYVLPEEIFESCFKLIDGKQHSNITESGTVELDERTIAKDIFDPIENAKLGAGLTAKLNIDFEKGIKLLDEIGSKLQEMQNSFNKLNNAKIEANSSGKADINVSVTCSSKDDAEKARECIAKNIKNMFDPVENVTATLKQNERTIKDCMIDMIMEEKAEELRKKFFKYLTLKLNELHEEIQKGGNNSAPRRAEDYKKLVECRRSICNMSIKDFLNCSEKDFCQLFGFGPNKTFNYLMEDIHYETEFNKEKDNEQNI